MRYALVIIAALFLTSAVFALQASQPSESTGAIIGIVVNASGQPVAGCIVTAQENAQRMRLGVQGTTDKDGKFKLDKVAEGDYNLNVRSPDARGRALKSASVLPGKTTDVGKLTLR